MLGRVMETQAVWHEEEILEDCIRVSSCGSDNLMVGIVWLLAVHRSGGQCAQ